MNIEAVENEGRLRFARAARITGRVWGIIVIILLLFIVVSDAAEVIKNHGWRGLIDNDSLYILVPSFLATAAFMLAIWREFAGGIALIGAYLILALSPNVLDLANAGDFKFYAGLFAFGAPLLICGALFIAAARLYKKAQS
jgi:hypothetical protein